MHISGRMIPEDLDEKIELAKSQVNQQHNVLFYCLDYFLWFYQWLSWRQSGTSDILNFIYECTTATSARKSFLISACFHQSAVPFFVSCTSGTTVQGAFDPLDRIADVCEKHKLWMHVDVSPAVGDTSTSPHRPTSSEALCVWSVSGCLGRECAVFWAAQTSDERSSQV